MLPIWIINLCDSEASKTKLQSLFGAMAESQKPFWHLTTISSDPISDIPSCRALMDTLVSDGRACYNGFIKAGYPVNNFQIVIIGAADGHLSQSIFASLPGLIRDYLPKIVPDHANLGVEVTGLLYVPSTINQLNDEHERERAAMLMEDVNMLTSTLGAKHFNRVIAYQDVQYTGARFYPGLDEDGRVELLFQMLCHLFLVGERTERLFDKIGQESGVFSLGAASIFYNSEQHQSYELKRLLDKLLVEFKEQKNTDDEYAKKRVRELLEDKEVVPESISARLLEGCGSLDIDLKKLDGEADPHPVWDLFRSDLIPSYYRKFLKFMPARLVCFVQSLSYVLLIGRSDIIRRNREKAVKDFSSLLKTAYRKVLLDNAARYATIAQLESLFREAKSYFGENRSKISLVLHEIVPIPKYLRNDYNKCFTDEDSNKPSSIIESIKKNLKREPIALSLLVRCFLLGILLVFTIVPLLRILSPKVVNLGEIVTIEWLWIPVLFFLPLIVEFFIKLRRHFKRIQRLKYRLLATTLLSVNKRLSKLLMDEEGMLYDDLANECTAQLNLLSEFRKILKSHEAKTCEMIIPETRFNQSLIGGSFCGENLIEDETITESQICIEDETLRLSELEQKDLLKLLKSAFRTPETLSAADLGDDKSVFGHAESLVTSFEEQFVRELKITVTEDAGSMLRLLDGNVNIVALAKMAGVNGMLFSKPSNNGPVVRITNASRDFSDLITVSDVETKDYVMYTTWQKLSEGLNSTMVCNCKLEKIPSLSFGDKLSLYYGYYRQKDLAYSLAGYPVRVPKDEMDMLDKQIIGG